jgi:signal transduction histidine kinase
LIVARDITLRKEAEQERQMLEVQLRQAQKLESIGQLAAGIAHEINTPTQFIGDNTRFVRDAFADIQQLLATHDRLLEAAGKGGITPELLNATQAARRAADLEYLTVEIPKAIDQTLDGVERVTQIVRAMKEFSHPGTEAKVMLDLNKAIESTATVCRSEWKYVADLAAEFDPSLPTVPVLPGEFNQVILNVLINATHAIADVVGESTGVKGLLTVSTRHDGEWAEIRITDTGTGIPEKARDRVFDPFFTTKAVGKGTGQGLAIARSVVVDKHGGTIRFETVMGKGTTFIIRLPLKPSAVKETSQAA